MSASGPRRRRILCNSSLSPAELGSPSTLELLERFDLEPIVVAPPGDDSRVEVLARLSTLNLPLGIALLPSRDPARGFSIHDAPLARSHAESALWQAHRMGLEIGSVCFPFSASDLRFWGRSEDPARGSPALFPERRRGADRELNALVAWLRREGIESVSLVPVSSLFEHRLRSSELPSLSVGWDRIAPMLYSPVVSLQGWLDPLVRGGMELIAAEVLHRLGPRAAAAVGRVGAGPRGDGPMLSMPEVLAKDVASVSGAGIEDLVLDGLDGVLRRYRPEGWLEAFVWSKPKPQRSLTRLAARVRRPGGIGRS